MNTATVEVASKTAIRPFTVDIPEEHLADPRRRVAATRWPERETVTDDTQGVQTAQPSLGRRHLRRTGC
jgi:epoxide hydrolase-like protein